VRFQNCTGEQKVNTELTSTRTRMQKFVDGRLKSDEDSTVQLQSFGKEVQVYLQMNDPQQITYRLLQETVQLLDAEGAIISVHLDGQERTVHKVGNWRGKAAACIPLECQDRRYGLLFLGPNKSGRRYTRQEFTTLETVANQVARTVHLNLSFRTHPPTDESPWQ
jgi:GAF domain-containing protein